MHSELGMACEGYKWQQDQSHVEVYVLVPEGAATKQASQIADQSGLFLLHWHDGLLLVRVIL